MTSDAPASQAAAWRLAALLAAAGATHFVLPRPYDKVVPHALPGNPRAYTYASGVAELGVAALLAMPRTRRTGGYLAAALFIAVLPANVQMAADWARSPKLSPVLKAGAWARLPLQVPLVTEALKAARNAR